MGACACGSICRPQNAVRRVFPIGPRLRLNVRHGHVHARGHPRFHRVHVGRTHNATGNELGRILSNRVFCTPRLIALGVNVPALGRRRRFKRQRRVFAEVQHVVVVGMTTHAHGDQLDQGGPSPARAGRRPKRRRRQWLQVCASTVRPGIP